MRYFYLEKEKIKENRIEVSGREARHIARVLRKRPGDLVRFLDGENRCYTASVKSVEKDLVILDLLGVEDMKNGSFLKIVVAQSLLKEKKMEDLIRPLSELGVDSLLPVISERTIAVPGPRIEKRLKRWETIAIEAMKQCKRGAPLKILPMVPLVQAMDEGKDYDEAIFFWEKAGGDGQYPLLRTAPASVILFIGPEGGFTEKEADAARSAGIRILGLGPRILRSQTAAISAAAIFQYIWGDLGKIDLTASIPFAK